MFNNLVGGKDNDREWIPEFRKAFLRPVILDGRNALPQDRLIALGFRYVGRRIK